MLDLVHSLTFESVMNGLLAPDGICLASPSNRRPLGRSNPADWAEYQLEGYLAQFDRTWWIRHGGSRPRWDLLCHIVVQETPGLLLVEAKAHESEMSQQDHKRRPDPASAGSVANDQQIRRRITETNQDLSALGVGAFALGWLQSQDWPCDSFRDGAHWDQVMSGYMNGVVPAAFPGRVFPTSAGGSMRMLIRSLPAP